MAPIPQRLRARLTPGALRWLDGYVQYLRNGPHPRSEDTIRTYVRHLATFVRHLPTEAAVAWETWLTRQSLQQVLLAVPHHQAATRRNMVHAIRTMSAYLAEAGVVAEEQHRALAGLRVRSKHQPQREHLREEELAQLMNGVLRHPGYSEPERLCNLSMIALLARTGLRASELCQLRLGDIDMERGLITVVHGKGNKRRTVGLPRPVRPLLELYLAQRPETANEYAFVGGHGQPLNRDALLKRFQRFSKLIGRPVSPHRLRRSFATSVAHKGISLDKLQVVLGHADITTTRLYVQTSGLEVAVEMAEWF